MNFKKIFSKKSDEELKKSEISKLNRTYNLDKDLSEDEIECFYYAQLNFKEKKLDKKIVENIKEISKIMANEESETLDVLVAQNFLIINLLNNLNNNSSKK